MCLCGSIDEMEHAPTRLESGNFDHLNWPENLRSRSNHFLVVIQYWTRGHRTP